MPAKKRKTGFRHAQSQLDALERERTGERRKKKSAPKKPRGKGRPKAKRLKPKFK